MSTSPKPRRFGDPPQAVVQYQSELRDALETAFDNNCEVRSEWLIAGGDTLWRRPRHPYRTHPMYEPRIDVAVGPFAIEHRYGVNYDRLVEDYAPVLGRIVDAHRENVVMFQSEYPAAAHESVMFCNHNARCLLAIEIEKGNVSAKYLMGSAFNAAALGRLGIVICWDATRLLDILGLREYLCFLAHVGKNTFSPDNLIIVRRDQMDAALADS